MALAIFFEGQSLAFAIEEAMMSGSIYDRAGRDTFLDQSDVDREVFSTGDEFLCAVNWIDNEHLVFDRRREGTIFLA
jgi:hypothetical protein